MIVAVISALCLGVALGFMSGVVFSHHLLGHFGSHGEGYGHHGWRSFHRGPPGEGPGVPSPRAIVPRLTRLLDLTPAQADAIRGEIERSRGDFAQVRDSLHVRIERHLTPAQRDKWRDEVRERDHDQPDGLPPHNLRGEPGREGEHPR